MAPDKPIRISGARELSAEELQRTYLEEVHAYVSRRLPRREDAEDATAETFAAAFAHLKRMRGKNPRLWLFGIARRKVVNAYRRFRGRIEVPLDEIHGLHDVPVPELDDARELRRLVLELPEDQRESLLLQYVEGFSQDEIAEIMGRSKAAVNSLQQRARANVMREGRSFFLPEEST